MLRISTRQDVPHVWLMNEFEAHGWALVSITTTMAKNKLKGISLWQTAPPSTSSAVAGFRDAARRSAQRRAGTRTKI